MSRSRGLKLSFPAWILISCGVAVCVAAGGCMGASCATSKGAKVDRAKEARETVDTTEGNVENSETSDTTGRRKPGEATAFVAGPVIESRSGLLRWLRDNADDSDRHLLLPVVVQYEDGYREIADVYVSGEGSNDGEESLHLKLGVGGLGVAFRGPDGSLGQHCSKPSGTCRLWLEGLWLPDGFPDDSVGVELGRSDGEAFRVLGVRPRDETRPTVGIEQTDGDSDDRVDESPFAPAREIQSKKDATEAVGEHVVVRGNARNAKLGAAVHRDDLLVYARGREEWPSDLTGGRVAVRGRLERTDDFEAERTADGAISQGTGSPVFFVRGATFERL